MSTFELTLWAGLFAVALLLIFALAVESSGRAQRWRTERTCRRYRAAMAQARTGATWPGRT